MVALNKAVGIKKIGRMKRNKMKEKKEKIKKVYALFKNALKSLCYTTGKISKFTLQGILS